MQIPEIPIGSDMIWLSKTKTVIHCASDENPWDFDSLSGHRYLAKKVCSRLLKVRKAAVWVAFVHNRHSRHWKPPLAAQAEKNWFWSRWSWHISSFWGLSVIQVTPLGHQDPLMWKIIIPCRQKSAESVGGISSGVLLALNFSMLENFQIPNYHQRVFLVHIAEIATNSFTLLWRTDPIVTISEEVSDHCIA